MKAARTFAALFSAFVILVGAFAEEEDSVAKLDAARRETIKFGTDAEIMNLLAALESEKLDYLDAELIGLLNASRGVKMVDSLLSYFTKAKRPGGEKKALDILENRDREANSNVFSAISYLSANKSAAASKHLRSILEAEESRFAAAAARALGQTGSDKDAEFLVRYVEDYSPADSLIAEIIFALGELKSKKATDYLLGLAASEDTKPVRKMSALEALGKIGDKEAVDGILAALREQDANVRASAISALGSFSGRKVDEALVESFRDSFHKVRAAAAQAVGERKLAQAIPFLKFRAERDEVPAVREECVKALGKIGTKEALGVLSALFADKKTPERIRMAAARALLEKDADAYAKDVAEALSQAKADKRTALYHGLAKSISETKTPAFEELARAFLSSTDVVDKHYGLDLAILNGYKTLRELLEPLAKDANPSLARKARRALSD